MTETMIAIALLCGQPTIGWKTEFRDGVTSVTDIDRKWSCQQRLAACALKKRRGGEGLANCVVENKP